MASLSIKKKCVTPGGAQTCVLQSHLLLLTKYILLKHLLHFPKKYFLLFDDIVGTVDIKRKKQIIEGLNLNE